MVADTLRIQMLGEFTLQYGCQEISDNDNRSRKVWLLLAYMIYCRNRSVSQEDLVNLLWGEEERSSNPLNALKTIFHRVRTMLNQLDAFAGHTLIIRRDGSYAWNPDVEFFFDVEEFEALCRAGAAAAEEDVRLENYLQALDLYQGDFLTKLSSEPWVVPISAYFHNLYTQTVLETLPLLEAQNRLMTAVSLCRKAVALEPYNETLYRHLMQELLSMGDNQGAITVYEEMSELLFSNFGIMPSEELWELHRQAARTVNDRAVSMSAVQEQLREPDGPRGALVCEYDFFKILYHAEARSILRSGNAVHIGLLSVTSESGGELPKRSLDRVMENLLDLIRSCLRKGDIASRCSVSQFILMLPQANYENSCMVCERIIKSFCRQYPHSPAQLHYTVQPLEPNV